MWIILLTVFFNHKTRKNLWKLEERYKNIVAFRRLFVQLRLGLGSKIRFSLATTIRGGRQPCACPEPLSYRHFFFFCFAAFGLTAHSSNRDPGEYLRVEFARELR